MRTFYLIAIIFSFSLLFSVVSCVTKEYEVTENFTEIEMRTEYKTESYTDIETVVTQIPSEEMISPSIKWGSPYLTGTGGLDFNCGTEGSGEFEKKLWYFGYDITAHRGSHIKIVCPEQLQKEVSVVAIYDLINTGHIDAPPYPDLIDSGCTGCCLQPRGRFSRWLASANAKLKAARYLGGESYSYSGYYGTGEIECATNGAKTIGVLIYGPVYPWNTQITTKLVWYDTNVEKRTVVKERQVPYLAPCEVEKQRKVIKTERVPIWSLFFD